MIALDRETKKRFRNLNFPDYITTDIARIKYIIEKFNNNG